MKKEVTQDDLNEIEEICYNDGYEIDDIQDAMTVLADDLVKEITEDFEPDILKGVKFIEYQIKYKQDNNEYDIDTPVEVIDNGMPEDCSFYEAKQYLNSRGYMLIEAYDASRERTYKKYGAKTPEQKAKIDDRLDWKARQDNIDYLEDKYEKENIRNRKSAVPVADAMMEYIRKNYKDVDIWSYDDGYYNPVTGDHYAPKNNYNTITFHCGPDIGREWCIYWYVRPDKQPVEIAEEDKKFLTWDRHYKRYTGKFEVEAFIDKEHKYIEILNEDEVFDMIDKIFAKAIELKETK